MTRRHLLLLALSACVVPPVRERRRAMCFDVDAFDAMAFA